jgi:hypothetical protein
MKYFPIFAALLLLFCCSVYAEEKADDEITKNIKFIEVAEYTGDIIESKDDSFKALFISATTVIKEVKDHNFNVFIMSGKNNQEQIYFQDLKTKKICQITGITNDHRPFSDVLFKSPGILNFKRYSNPHHGIEYEINLAEKKLIHAKIISDEDKPVAQEVKTIVNDKAAKKKLLGRHLFSLQWIGWNYFGTASITEQSGTVKVDAEQKSRENSDYVKMIGILTVIDSLQFKFRGTIETQVYHLNGGKPCKREGDFTFAIKANRKYWRLQEMNNPCDAVVDYVDIYF